MGRRLILTLLLLVISVATLSAQSSARERRRATRKIEFVLDYLQRNYIDEVPLDTLVEAALVAMFDKLDPHSRYLPPEEMHKMYRVLNSQFAGVGISLMQHHDTLFVRRVVEGSPAQRAGLMYGDRITSINNRSTVGMHRDSAILLLQGEAGTSLHLEVERRSNNAQLGFDVVRDFVASPSIGSALMLNDTTAYVRINNFARSTPQDLRVSLAKLQDFEHLIIDLRGNTGGLLPSVVNICGMFLQPNALIVTTEGRAEPTHEYRTKYAGEYSDIPLTILIDEHTASASEIFAGAMQDNDRAVVIGRTSYGKGLVQRLINIGDDCGIAVTRARYKTPSGRTIQRPYTKGDKRGYHNDSMRYNHPDSIRRDRDEVFYTLNEHREVYGGGGITPDIYIAEEMIDTTSYRGRALKQNVVSEVAVDIFDREGYTNFMSHYPTFEMFATRFILDDASRAIIEHTMAGSEATDSDREWLCDMIRARIAYDIYGEEAYIDIYKMYDEPLIQALYLHK